MYKEKWKFESIQLLIKQKKEVNLDFLFSFYILKERLEKNENTYI